MPSAARRTLRLLAGAATAAIAIYLLRGLFRREATPRAPQAADSAAAAATPPGAAVAHLRHHR